MNQRLSPMELHQIEHDAEFGRLYYNTISKRQFRILMALYVTIPHEENNTTLPYSNIQTITLLIESLKGKLYPEEEILYWTRDLQKRRYLIEHDEPSLRGHFSLTEEGLDLFQYLCSARESLLESNSQNSLEGIDTLTAH